MFPNVLRRWRLCQQLVCGDLSAFGAGVVTDEIKFAWLIFIDWVFKSNLGFNIILLLLKMFMYIMIILFFGDVLRIIIEIQ